MQELRGLSLWSEAHVWVSPEQHGTLTAVFKNQIDWIPLSLGSVRPSQGRTLAVAQVRPHALPTQGNLLLTAPTPSACLHSRAGVPGACTAAVL